MCVFISSGETRKKRKEGEEIVVQGLQIILCGMCSSARAEFYFLYFGLICSYIQ